LYTDGINAVTGIETKAMPLINIFIAGVLVFGLRNLAAYNLSFKSKDRRDTSMLDSRLAVVRTGRI